MSKAPTESSLKLRVVMIGIGGATCSGKTTLAKHLKFCLPNSILIHQDDFAASESELPIHSELGVKDWDDPPTAIQWKKMATELAHIKTNGSASDLYQSREHLNTQKPVPVEKGTTIYWKAKFTMLESSLAREGEKIVWVIVDGFLLYWDADVYGSIDVPIFLREPETVLRERRAARSYSLVGGDVWQDPPRYWEVIAWPSFLKAHKDLFAGGDVENGTSSGKVPELLILNGKDSSMTELFDRTCRRISTVMDTM